MLNKDVNDAIDLCFLVFLGDLRGLKLVHDLFFGKFVEFSVLVVYFPIDGPKIVLVKIRAKKEGE